MKNLKNIGVASVLMLSVFIAEKSYAVVTLPTTGVDLEEYVLAAATLIGTAVAAVIGAWFAFKAIKIGLKWAGKIGG